MEFDSRNWARFHRFDTKRDPAETITPSIRRLLQYTEVEKWGDRRTVVVDKDLFVEWLRSVIEKEPFDEEWYLQTYSDVREAVSAGFLKSGHEHYISTGYFEGRLPGLFGFEAGKYIELNPDLHDFTKDQALQHFIHSGYGEGRRY